MTVTTLAPVVRVTAGNGPLTLLGGPGRDIVTGGPADDRLFGGAGDDQLFGEGGNDLIVSGTGQDRLHGGAGDDLIIATGARSAIRGGAGADSVLIARTASAQTIILHDFDPAAGDRIVIHGLSPADIGAFLAASQIRTANGKAILRHENLTIQVMGADGSVFNSANVTAPGHDTLTTWADFDAFRASGLDAVLDQIRIGDVIWHLRDAAPVHDLYRAQDSAGHWWSPDYLVVVAAGQSNMLGAGAGGDMTLGGAVAAWDWVNGTLVAADYGAPPSGGPGVRTGAALRNNLYFPFAEELAAAEGRPVLVVAHPVSGSRIESWLDSAQGVNWASLTGDIAAALAATGQDRVDAFLWLQGEGDFPMPTDQYQARLLDFIAQVRGAGWASPGLDILIGELSRWGANAAQNAALQQVEVMGLPNVGFVSSTGLAAFDRPGVHFDGPSLVTYGQRFFDLWSQMQSGVAVAPNSAPQVVPGAALPTHLTVAEGDRVTVDLRPFFTDSDSDPLWFFGQIRERGVYLTGPAEHGVMIRPDYDAAGTYTLTVHANDYLLDSASITVTLTVTDRAPGILRYQQGDFLQELGRDRDFALAAESLANNRAIDVLDQAALDPSGMVLAFDGLHIRGGTGLAAAFLLGEGVRKAFFHGAAAFDMTGNDLDNILSGNDGANRLWGGAGRDQLLGGGGDDMLAAGAGDDSLFGGDGDDLILCGPGNDQAWGGAGADVFVFAMGDGRLTVRDLDPLHDHLRLEGWQGITDHDTLCANARIFQAGDRMVIDIGTDRLMLDGVVPSEVTADLFSFA